LEPLSAKSEFVQRHALPVRLWHWVNALAVLGLLLSGFLILNVHPRLYWGNDGHNGMPALAELTVDDSAPDAPISSLSIGSHTLDVSGWMGSALNFDGTRYVQFWLPPESWHFGAYRAWHFALAWVFLVGWLLYAIYLGVGRRRWAGLMLDRDDLRVRRIGREFLDHLLLKRARGDAATRYNSFQKFAYLAVLFILIPVQVATGLAMSNSIDAAFPWVVEFWGGHQSARTVHFLSASLITAFLLIHLFQLFVSGFLNQMRGMITGRFRIDEGEA
jgi:thiosulfate reductase cytochrome b subunit